MYESASVIFSGGERVSVHPTHFAQCLSTRSPRVFAWDCSQQGGGVMLTSAQCVAVHASLLVLVHVLMCSECTGVLLPWWWLWWCSEETTAIPLRRLATYSVRDA